MGDSYRQVGSFESGRVEAVGVGDGAVAVGIDDRVEIVAGSRRDRIDHGDRIVDVAVADRVIVLSSGELTTYSRDGDRLWSQHVADATAIAAITDEGTCGVLEPDRLRGIDVATGRERFDVERSRPGSPDDDIRAVPTGFLLTTWSFLTHVTVDGEADFDRDLGAVVRSVGHCDDAIVAALQSDQLVGLDATTGETRWRTELEATHVAPVGESSVLVGTAAGTRTVGPDGSVEPVGDVPAGDVYAAADGSIVCSVREGTVSTHVHDRNRLGLAVATDAVGVGGTIDVEVTNPTDREQTASVAVDVANCELSPGERTVTVGPGETTLVDFPVATLHAEGRVNAAIAVDGSVVARERLSLEDAASGTLAVETDLEVAAIEDGVARLAVTVENVGGVPLESVGLLETGESTADVPPGERWTGTVTRPYEPERRVSVGLEAARGDRRREYAPTCTLPSKPTIDVETDGDAVRATVTVDGGVTVSDRVVIELPRARRVRSPVTIDGDELLLLVPTYEDGTARIGFDSLDVDERVRLTGSGPFTTPSASSASERRSRDPSQTGRSGSSESVPDGRTGRNDGEGAADDGRPTEPEPATDPGSNPGADRSTDRDSTVSAAPESDAGRGTGSSDPGGDDRSILSATRSVSDDSPSVGHAVRDRIVLESDGSVTDVSVAVGDERVDVGRIDAGERRTLERVVSAASSDDLRLPAATVEADGTVVDRCPERRLAVDDAGVAVRAAVDRSEGTVVARLENRGDRACRLFGLEIDDCDHREPLEARLEPGETTTVTARPDGRPPTDADALALSVAVRDESGAEETIETLAGVVPSLEEGDADADDASLTAEVGPETQVAGEYGSVVLVFENESDRALSDVSVAAAGEPINEMFYSEARREVLEAGDWIEHFVDLEAGVEAPTFDATVRYAVDGTEREYTVRASGPAVDEEADWTDDHLEAWSLERLEDDSPSVPELPSSLSTPFRSEG